MIAYYWLQREEDIVKRFSWSHYRPVDAPDVARIFHHKTGELVDIVAFYPVARERGYVVPMSRNFVTRLIASST